MYTHRQRTIRPSSPTHLHTLTHLHTHLHTTYRYFEHVLTRKSAFDEEAIHMDMSDQLKQELIFILNKDLVQEVRLACYVANDYDKLTTVQLYRTAVQSLLTTARSSESDCSILHSRAFAVYHVYHPRIHFTVVSFDCPFLPVLRLPRSFPRSFPRSCDVSLPSFPYLRSFHRLTSFVT